MSVTPIGWVIIPVSLIFFFVAPRFLVPWAIAVSVLQAASVFNVSGAFPIGITPYFFVTILICLRFVPQWLSGRLGFGFDEYVRLYLRFLLLLVIWGLLSASTLPVLFKNTPVDTPRAGMDAAFSSPLHWTWSNGAQAGYLVLLCVFIIYILWQSVDRLQVERCIAAFRWSGAFAAGLGAYQLLAHATGLPYPASFFNSNLAWAQLFNQRTDSAWRVSATFTEPSAAGAFFATWTTLMLFSVIGDERARWSQWCLLAGGIVILAVTTSTTGYLVGATVIALFFGRQLLQVLVRGALRRKALVALVIVIAALAAGMLLLPDFSRVIRDVILYKSQSKSGRDRMATSVHGFQLLVQTLGLGVGLGSNRPSGLLSYIASNLGIPGLLLFLYLLYITRVMTVAASAAAANAGAASRIRACGWVFAASLLAAFAAGAEVTSPILWVSWGILLAACRHAFVTAPQPALDDAIAPDQAFSAQSPSEPAFLVNTIPWST